jgi:hypothetical protein
MQEETGCTYPQGRSSGQRRISLWCLDLAFLTSQVIGQSQGSGAERGSFNILETDFKRIDRSD